MVKWIGTAIAFGQGAAEIAWKGLKGTQWDGKNGVGLSGGGVGCTSICICETSDP